MCGIVGYIGPKPTAQVLIDGLKALEYRGYDSAGIAVLNGDDIQLVKEVGRVHKLEELVHAHNLQDCRLGIGHTRWATHGKPTEANAHPHQNTAGTIFVVHNGIIENYLEIKERLSARGYVFVTETDTEVIPQLLDYYYQKLGSFDTAFRATIKDLAGAYAIVALTAHAPDKLFAAKLSSPLLLGVGDGEMMLASDPSAVVEHTNKVVYLEDNQIMIVERGSYHVEDAKSGEVLDPSVELLEVDVEKARLGKFPHFMIKEIFEAPETIRLATAGRVQAETGTLKLGGLELVGDRLKKIERIIIVACGTASYAGMIGEYLIEELAGIPVEVQLGSEFRYRHEPFSPNTAVLAVSQSGETADTLAALKKVEELGMLRLGVVNVVGSTIARMTDAGVYCHAGPEQAVASTKAFIAQVTILLQISLYLGREKHPLYQALLEELEALPAKAESVLGQAEAVEKLAKKYAGHRDFMFIGRRYNYPCALEGALKVKETSYIHAEGYAAGETKHGPIALIDENFPTFAVATDSDLLEKTYSNIEEIRARKGPVIAVATEGNDGIKNIADDVIYVPKTLEQTAPILVGVVMQLFAYYIAVEKGFDVDKPRNLAKSVTVE